MGKGNLFLGFGRGSVGDITYYRAYGEQVFRGRNRHPANPQTTLQLLQRVVMLTVQHAYSFMSSICDHAFQGRPVGTMSQSRFTQLNVAKMRADLGDAIEQIITGIVTDWPTLSNYAAKGSFLPEFMPYIVSEGSIQSIAKSWNAGKMMILDDPDTLSNTSTYEEFAAALGLQRGDQLTFLSLTIDDTDTSGQFNGFKFARIVLEPSTESGWSQAMFTAAPGGVGYYTVANPNAANEGDVFFGFGENGVNFSFGDPSGIEPASVAEATGAFAVIISRRVGDVWQRSTETLLLRPFTVGTGNLQWDHAVDFLGDAIESFKIKAGSALYLNQADNV